MKINERLYPHPVLAHFSDDLVNCIFQVTAKVHATKNSYKFNVTSRTSNADLKAMVAEGKAVYGIHVECATTRFRKLLTAKEEEFSEEIPGEYLDGRVEVCTLIVATDDISDYKNSDSHPDYGDTSFFVKKGDVLAVGHDILFDAIKDIDPLQNVSSIFRVSVNRDPDPLPFDVDLLGDHISIRLSEENFDAYGHLQRDQNQHSTLASMIITPALVYLLEWVQKTAGEDEDAFVNLRWYKVIRIKLKELGYPGLDSWKEIPSLELAQKLIGDPLSGSLKTILESEEEGSEE